MIRAARNLIDRLGGPSLIVLSAMLIIVAGTWTFIKLADEVREHATQTFDDWTLRSLRHSESTDIPIGPHWLEGVARDITALGSPIVLILITAAVTGYLLIIRKYGAAWLVLLATSGGAILGGVLKYFFARERPLVVPRLVDVTSYSFPSGHSMFSAVVYLTLGSLLARIERGRLVKMYFISIALLLTFLIGITRVYLGVHYPTDVLAGWTAGLVWAVICWLVARYLQHQGAVETDKPTPQDSALRTKHQD